MLLSWIDTGSSIARDGVKLFIWAQATSLREIMAMQLCKCLVNNINVNITGIVKKIDIKAISTKGFTKTRVNCVFSQICSKF